MKFDFSRQVDIARLEREINDPRTPDRVKRKAETALYAIKDQSKYRSIQKLREEITRAHLNGDTAKIERLTREAQRIDKDYSN